MKLSAGVRFMLIATVTFSVMKVLVKLIPHIPAVEIVLFRSIISLVICVWFLQKQQLPFFGSHYKILILRGIVGATSLISYFTLLQQIPLATAATMQYLAPIFTALLGVYLVKESVKAYQWLFFALSFSGVLIIQGFDTRISWAHLALGLTAALCSGLAYNFIRMLKHTEHPLVIMLYFPMVTIPVAGVWSAFVWVTPTGLDWIILIGVGLCTQVAQYYMTKSYLAAVLSKVSILNYLGFVYALLFGWILFDESFNAMTYLGIGLAMSGILANILPVKKEATHSNP